MPNDIDLSKVVWDTEVIDPAKVQWDTPSPEMTPQQRQVAQDPGAQFFNAALRSLPFSNRFIPAMQQHLERSRQEAGLKDKPVHRIGEAPAPEGRGAKLAAGAGYMAPTMVLAHPFIKGAGLLTKLPALLRPALGFGAYEGLKALTQGEEPVSAAASGAGSGLLFGAGGRLGASIIPKGLPFAETLGSILGGGAVGKALSPEDDTGMMLGAGFGAIAPSKRAPLSSLGGFVGRGAKSLVGIKPDVYAEVEQKGFKNVIQNKYLDKKMPEQLQERIEGNLDKLEQGAIGKFDEATAPLRNTRIDWAGIRGEVVKAYNKVKGNPFKGDSVQLNDRIVQGIVNTKASNLGDVLDMRRFLADELYTSGRQGVKSRFGKEVYDIFNKYLHQNSTLKQADADWTTLQQVLREGKRLSGETGENFLKRFSNLTGKQKETLARLEKEIGGEPFIEDLTNWSLAQEFSTKTTPLTLNPFSGFGMLPKVTRPALRGYLRTSEGIGKGLDVGQEALNVGSERLRSGLERSLSSERGTFVGPTAKDWRNLKDRFVGTEGKMRSEIDDSRMRVSRKELPDPEIRDEFGDFPEPVPLDQVIDHPTLFKNYPQLRKIGVRQSLFGEGTGYQDGVIYLNRSYPWQQRSSLVHEIQHAIQDIEGFAKGGEVSEKEYKYLAGEVEARNAEKRMDFTPIERHFSPFRATEDVSPQRQIVRMNVPEKRVQERGSALIPGVVPIQRLALPAPKTKYGEGFTITDKPTYSPKGQAGSQFLKDRWNELGRTLGSEKGSAIGVDGSGGKDIYSISGYPVNKGKLEKYVSFVKKMVDGTAEGRSFSDLDSVRSDMHFRLAEDAVYKKFEGKDLTYDQFHDELFKARKAIEKEVEILADSPKFGKFLGAGLLSLSSQKSSSIPDEDGVKAILGEAENEGKDGMQMIGEVTRRRGSLKGIYGAKAIYIKDGKYFRIHSKTGKLIPIPDKVVAEAKQAWKDSATSDLSQGATHWQSEADLLKSHWDRHPSFKVTKKYGGHTFLKEVKIRRKI